MIIRNITKIKDKGCFKVLNASKAQTSLEYVVLVTVLLAALISVGVYFKRALQGRWKTTVDDLGDQYDPRAGEAFIEHKLLMNSDTTILAINETTTGWWTSKEDVSNMIETREGYVEAEPYVE
jgi:Flp pilus assembly pilin Flp